MHEAQRSSRCSRTSPKLAASRMAVCTLFLLPSVCSVLSGCQPTERDLSVNGFGTVLSLPASSLASLTDQDPRQVFGLDLSRYLNDTDWLRMQLKTFLFPGQPDLLFDIPEPWTRDGETLVCTTGDSVFRFSLSEAGTLASEELEGSGDIADRSMTFEPLQVTKTDLQRLDQLFSLAAAAKAGHKVTLP